MIRLIDITVYVIVDVYTSAEAGAGGPDAVMKQFTLNQEKLKRTWEVSQRSTKEDWEEWMKMFSIELLRESPSPSLRSCSSIAQVSIALVRYNTAVISNRTADRAPTRTGVVQRRVCVLLVQASPNISRQPGCLSRSRIRCGYCPH